MTLGDEAAARNTRTDRRTPTPAPQPAQPAEGAEQTN